MSREHDVPLVLEDKEYRFSGYAISILSDACWKAGYDSAIRKVKRDLEEILEITSQETGHGKAQRAFANKLLDALAGRSEGPARTKGMK
jgi:hypothetical protein